MAYSKRLLTILTFFVIVIGAFADNGINSPYSRYGLGILSDQNLGINRQMGGLGYALRSNGYINLLNPASISEIDSLTMLFEAGFSLQNVNFKENGKKINAHNASFDYLAMEFRIRKGLGLSLGFMPYSNVGYSFSNTSKVDDNSNSINNYNGTGGLYQPYVAIGWSPIKDFSLGITASYLYGDISHTISSTISNDANARSRARYYKIDVSNYKLDFGIQYSPRFNDKHSMTIGAVYSLGHNLNADAQIIGHTLTNGTIETESSDTIKIKDGFKIPHTIGFGVIYNYGTHWRFGADYTFQGWGSSDFFGDNKGENRSKISVGAEYSPNKISRNILKMMNYRAGLYYAQPYTNVNGKSGCEEYGASLGFSIPIRNNYNTRSMVHISGQYIHMEPKSAGMIEENYLRINIGITFNENWFNKIKVK
ncbi:MAG: hypothetical protein IKJ31_02890 [Bacteroidaceae bacterium]|nr:hypothetical protein [Bacteroidaceae bacterium]